MARFPPMRHPFLRYLTVPTRWAWALVHGRRRSPVRAAAGRQAAISKLAAPDPSRLTYVYDAVASIKLALAGSVPLIVLPAAHSRSPAT